MIFERKLEEDLKHTLRKRWRGGEPTEVKKLLPAREDVIRSKK